MSEQTEQHEVSVRRAPKYGAFMAVGGLFGLLATLILTAMFPADPLVGFAASFGYFAVFGVPIGVALGGVLALVLDRAASRRARSATAQRGPSS